MLFCQFIALALLCHDVYHYRLCAVLDLAECSDQRRDIVAVLHENVVQSHCPEQVALCLAVCIPEEFQILVQTAVVLCDGHIVVIDHNDKVGVHLAGKVQTLQRLAAAE